MFLSHAEDLFGFGGSPLHKFKRPVEIEDIGVFGNTPREISLFSFRH
jgi:hypothetical protein